MSNFTPLRCEAFDIQMLFLYNNTYEDLILIKDKCFESSQDFLQEARRIITLIKTESRPWNYQTYNQRSSASFAFLWQKIDEFYRRESQNLQALFEKEGWEDSDFTKEKEIKSTLKDLFKCEMAIEKVSDNLIDVYSPNLASQLEHLFDDCELLDLLLLVLSVQLNGGGLDNQPDRLKTLYFMFPYLKLFYGGGEDDLVEICKNHQELLKKSNAIEESQHEIKKLLNQHTDLSENEISRFYEEIKSKYSRRIVTQLKNRFKEEKYYYEVLGNLSLLLNLKRQQEAGDEVFMPLVRIGVACYRHFLDGWRNIKSGFGMNQFEYYYRFSELNLQDRRDLPIRMMKSLLKEKDLNEEYLQLLELNLTAFGTLVQTIQQNDNGKEFNEEFADSCLLNYEGSNGFLLHDYYEFLNSNMTRLNQMKSSYAIESLLSESLISNWLELSKGMDSWGFIGAESDGKYAYKEKYRSPARRLLRDLIEFITCKKGHILVLPEYLQANMMQACEYVFKDRNILERSDVEEVYLSVQSLGIEILVDLKKEVPIAKEVLSRFRLNANLSGLLANKWKDLYHNDTSEGDFLKIIYESQLMEELIAVYEANPSLLQKAGDMNLTETIWEFIDFISKSVSRDRSFISKERNINFLKLVLQDSCGIDLRLVNIQPCNAFFNGLDILLGEAEFAKHLKDDEKLLFGILRIVLFRPTVSNWEWSGVSENFCKLFSEDLVREKIFVHLFGKLLEVFENKLRNPSFDFYDALKRFENGIFDEKKKYQETIEQEGERAVETHFSYLADKEAPFITEETSIHSLQIFAEVLYKRLSEFVAKIPSAFAPNLEKLKEQVESVVKRFMKMIVGPLAMFSCNSSIFKTLGRYISSFSYMNEGILACAFEGYFAGIIEICKEFKFNELSVILKLNVKRLCKVINQISTTEFLRTGDISRDITYQEAALMSLIIGVKFFNKNLRHVYISSTKQFERLEGGFKEAMLLIDQVRNNVLKCVSLEIVNESLEKNGQDIEATVQICKNLLERRHIILNLWNEIFKLFYGVEALKSASEEVYKTIIDPFDQEEKPCLAGILYRSLWLKEIDHDYDCIPDNLWINVITSMEGLKSILKIELYLLECTDAKMKDLVKLLSEYLEKSFTGRSISSNESDIKKNCFEKEEGIGIFKVILDFLKRLGEMEVLSRNCKRLISWNLNVVFTFFENFYKIYLNYTKEKVTSIDAKIEELKGKEGEDDSQGELGKLEKEKAKLIEDYKNEVQGYIDAVVQCQQHHLVNLKELFVLGEEFNNVVPRDYWRKLYQNACENLASYLRDSSDKQINLKEVSKYKSINQIYQLDFLYQCVEQILIKEIVSELSLEKDLIENFLTKAKETLKNLTSEDMKAFAQEKECTDFPGVLGGFISGVSKLAMNYIVSQVVENNCQLNEDNRLLSICLDLSENIFSAQKCILHGMKRDLSSASPTCFRDTVTLMNTVLRANKNLRVEFINRGLLKKLLTVESLSTFGCEGISSVLFLMMTLLEDGLMLDSQVDLALKSARKGKESSEISVEDLLKDDSFKSLKNYQRVLEKIQLAGNTNNDDDFRVQNLSPVAEKALEVILDSLFENYAFEKTSMASFEKVKERGKLRNIEYLNQKRMLAKDCLFVNNMLPDDEEWSDESNVFLGESLSRFTIVKDTSALVVVLSGILLNHTYLIPSIIFQELSIKKIMDYEPEILSFFKSNTKWSIYDVLLRLVLLKDGSSAVFLIVSLIQDNSIILQSVELKYILLVKTFEIINDLLDCEETQSKTNETLNSVLMRRNIAMIIASISTEINKDEGSCLGLFKEEILQLIMQTAQKLLQNPQMIGYSLHDSQPKNSMLRILSCMVKQNTSKSMKTEEIKSSYAEILKFIKTRDLREPKTFQVDELKQVFEKNIFVKKNELKNNISKEEQRKFEMWEEQSQWEKEETKRMLEIAGLKEKELLREVRFAAYGDASIGVDLTLSSIFSENTDLNCFETLYKPIEGDMKVGYIIERLRESEILGQIQKEREQTLGDNIDSDILLPLMKADLSKIERLKEEEKKELDLKEQNQNLQENSQSDVPKDTHIEDQNQEVHVKEEEIAPIEEKANKDDESTFKYFMDVGITNEANFKFIVNKALKECRRLKEMLCLEKTLRGSDDVRNQDKILEFTSKMTEFDKNVVYASLGKKFEAGLSEDFRKIAEESRKELEGIQKDFSQYEEEKNKISKPEEQKDNEEKKEDEDEEYGDFDYDFQFLAGEEKKEDANEKEDPEDEKEEETKELAAAEEEAKDESSPIEPENKDSQNEKIVSLINAFEVNDNFIMDAVDLLFCYINPNSGNQNLVIEFLKDSLGLNPVNELKILDILITILHTPDFFLHMKRKLVVSYEKAVDSILNYISKYFEDSARSHIFFVPKGYLKKFGVALLKDVKEATNFGQKISDCHTILDMLLGLIETESFGKNKQWSLKILEGVSSLLKNERKIKLLENAPQATLDRYKKVISCRKLLNLLSMIEKPTTDSDIKLRIQELFMDLKSTPELFIPFQDHLSNHFYQIIQKLNKELENSIRLFKQNQDKEQEIHGILARLNLSQFQLILTIIFSFANVFESSLIMEQGKKSSKASRKLRTLLGVVTDSLFNEEEVKTFFVNIHELAELLNKVQLPEGSNELFNLLIMICVGHYSIVIMESSIEKESAEGSSSLSDVEQTPALARLVSYEDTETQMMPLQKSYSYYRREVNVDFGAIFANFALKQSSRISKIATLPITGVITVMSNLISIIIEKFPWIMDFKSKMKLFESKVNDHLKKNDIDVDDRRRIEIDRKSITFSAMKGFKDLPIKDLLQLIQISYKDESGWDAGGLRRDFYEMITRQLFDPSVGLFKVSSNQISIQPNPFSGMIPYDSTLMQFAGLILAKAICDKMVVNLSFTKPFLKHLLGKRITIADMESVDEDLGKNLRWILENNVEDLCLTYTHEIEVLGERTVIELKEGGSDLSVEEENKKEYVKQICEYRMTKQIKKQLKDFLKGFRTALPRDFISNFSTSELEILIAGESKIDLEDMKKYIDIDGYSKTDQIIVWLWEVLGEFSSDQLTAFYYFVSGSTKVPFGGFKERVVRIRCHSNKDGLPVAHTCSYMMELPNYDSKDKLREKLLLAIFDGVGEFQIA